MEERASLKERILERLYNGESECLILRDIINSVESVKDGAICSILSLDEEGKVLTLKFAPNLPAFYKNAINGLLIGEGQGCCGTAAYTGKRVIVEDIAIHPYWKDFKELANKANLGSCWSEPIIDPSGRVLGTFAIYYREPNSPSSKDLKFIEELAKITAIVLDRYRIINQLKESENKFKTLANASEEAIFILNKDEIIELNNKATTLTGYSQLELLGFSFHKIIAKESWLPMMESFKKAKANDFKVKITCKNGVLLDGILRIKYSIYRKKSVCIVTLRDITMLTNAKTEIQKLSHAIIQSPVAIVITNKDWEIEYVNPKYEELTGYSRKEVLGDLPEVLRLSKNIEEKKKAIFKLINNGKSWVGEIQRKRKNGKLFWERSRISDIKNEAGEVVNYLLVKEDISLKKRQELTQRIVLNISNAVLSSFNLVDFLDFLREKLSEIIDTSNFFVALYDEKNQRFKKVYHNDKFDSLKFFPKKNSISGWVFDQGKCLLADQEKLQQMAKSGNFELFGTSSKVWLGMPLKRNSIPIGVLVIQSYDDEFAFTDEDRELLELISHQISITIDKRRIEDDLRDALYKAKESDKLKSVFLATMSHELRTPLNAVIGFSDLIDDETPIDTAIDYCKMINKSGQNLLHIVEDLFDISLIQSGTVKITHQNYSLVQILQEIDVVIQNEQLVLNKQHIKLQLVLPKEQQDFIFSTDPNRFKQIFLNLLKNALKFTDNGSIEYGLYDSDFTAELPFTFYVKDTGVGIPDAMKDSIFGMFRQANESLARSYNGVGIGLSIAKSLTELLGGKINLVSKVGKGSTFYFTHPVNKK